MARIFTILVIDDQALIGDAIAATLSGRGHQVTLAINGDDGMKQLSEGKFDLVITDLIMPGMGGDKTILQWGEVSEGLRVLSTSELKRPFSPAELIDAVDRVFLA